MGTVPESVASRLQGARLVAHLATCTDGRPHVAPVWYGYRGDDVVEVLTTGRKLDDIKANPRVSLSIQRDVDGNPEWFVVLRGTATIVDDDAENRRARADIHPKYGAQPGDWPENTLVQIAVGSVTADTY